MNSENYIRISGVVKESIVDGPGIRYVIFTQGCPHNCTNCHNPETHDLNGGKLIEIQTIINDIKKNPLLQGVTISGGDPFMQPKNVAKLLQTIKENSNLNIIVYTGFTYEYLLKNTNEKTDYISVLKLADILIDGKFDETLKRHTLAFRGSSNQRAIDLKESLKQNLVVIHKFDGEE